MPKRCQECRQEYTGPHHTDCPGLRPPVLPEPREASPEQRPAVTGRLLSIGPPLREYRWRNPLFLAIVFTVGLFSRQARGPAMHTFGQPYEVESWSMQVLDEQTGRSVAVVLVEPAGAAPEVGSRVAVFGARRRQNIEAERIRMLEDRHGNPMPGEVEWRNRRML